MWVALSCFPVLPYCFPDESGHAWSGRFLALVCLRSNKTVGGELLSVPSMPSKMLLCMMKLSDSSRNGAVLVIIAAVQRLCVIVIGRLTMTSDQMEVCVVGSVGTVHRSFVHYGWQAPDASPVAWLATDTRFFCMRSRRCTNAQMQGKNLGTVQTHLPNTGGKLPAFRQSHPKNKA